MEQGETEAGTGPSGLQFEQAEYEGVSQGAECSVCRKSLDQEYFLVNESAACRSCVDDLNEELEAVTPRRRLWGAVVYGIPAGCLGSGGCYGLVGITD